MLPLFWIQAPPPPPSLLQNHDLAKLHQLKKNLFKTFCVICRSLFGPTEGLCLFFLPTKLMMQFFPDDVHIIVVNNNIKCPSSIYLFSSNHMPNNFFRFIPISNPFQEKHSNLQLSVSAKHKRKKEKEKKWQDITPTRPPVHRASSILESHGLNL